MPETYNTVIHQQVCGIIEECTLLSHALERWTPSSEQCDKILTAIEARVMAARMAVDIDWRARRQERGLLHHDHTTPPTTLDDTA